MERIKVYNKRLKELRDLISNKEWEIFENKKKRELIIAGLKKEIWSNPDLKNNDVRNAELIIIKESHPEYRELIEELKTLKNELEVLNTELEGLRNIIKVYICLSGCD